ncbi:hypothetical protein CICLE_v10017949mg, partial [Citrus x clementina]
TKTKPRKVTESGNRKVMAAAAHLTLLLVILFWSFTLTSQNQQHSQQHLIAELQDAKLKIAGLESILEESIKK